MNKDLAIKIKKWKEFEQKLRFQAGKEYAKNNKTGIYNYLVYIIDAINNFRIKEIIRKFGTQFMTKNGKRIPCPIENKREVNVLRKSVGLETLEKYLEKANKLIKK